MNFLFEENGKKYFKIPLDQKGLVTCWFSTRSFTASDSQNECVPGLDAFKSLLSSQGARVDRLVFLKQVHGNDAVVVNGQILSSENSGEIGMGDALITDLCEMPLMIKVADCLSIQLYDPASGALGNIHCGWRSCAKNIIGLTIKKLIDLYGFDPAKSRVVMMPSISAAHYQVGSDVHDAFMSSFEDVERFFIKAGNEKWFFNLRGAAANILIGTGVEEANIVDLNLCSYEENDLFHSYRRDGNSAGRMFAVIEKRPENNR